MFINLSWDNIYILTTDDKTVLSRGSLERHISQTIIDLYQKYKPQNIYILNWPGSFTNLRLGCLAINLLNYLLTKTSETLPNIYMTDKISIYKAFHLPILIYIWQKNNYRFLNNNEIQKVSLTDLDMKNIYMDDLSDNIYVWLPKISFEYSDSQIFLKYDNLNLNDLNYNNNITWLFELMSKGNIAPNYMIAPNVS